ncbi:hypothetical protein D9619_002148 [Psilocybe cf. subviscida]|uniref:DRBM domain-containing protein n=1 Tax=Psilocybe cf. subviscida TaxID=2480587 RepID=A0A8H5F3I4_9AGAR|nr:hypothetical protein D9619_002148 [Psilocybe cf. subviscida]
MLQHRWAFSFDTLNRFRGPAIEPKAGLVVYEASCRPVSNTYTTASTEAGRLTDDRPIVKLAAKLKPIIGRTYKGRAARDMKQRASARRAGDHEDSNVSSRIILNNMVQEHRLTYTREFTTSGPQMDQVYTCKILVDGIQYGHEMRGRTKDSAFEAAAGTALAPLRVMLESASLGNSLSSGGTLTKGQINETYGHTVHDDTHIHEGATFGQEEHPPTSASAIAEDAAPTQAEPQAGQPDFTPPTLSLSPKTRTQDHEDGQRGPTPRNEDTPHTTMFTHTQDEGLA